uniref:Uncharacterized protein n=1 Tax=Caenorhabditis japonica TaxID=281687 RepID=A0A8R1ELM1_CAEJA
MPQTLSIGFRSDEHASHSSTLIFFEAKKARVLLYTVFWPLPQCKRAPITLQKHPGQVKTSRFLILSQPTGIRGCVILLEDEAISTEEQDELLFWDVLT